MNSDATQVCSASVHEALHHHIELVAVAPV